MIDEIKAVIEKKFTRCPQCRSFSVRETDNLTVKEKIQRYFRTVTIYICDNCSYRFGEFGKVSTRLKAVFIPPTGQFLKKYSRLVIPILALAVLATILLLAGGKEKKPVIPKTGETLQKVEKKPVSGVEKPKKQVSPSEKPGPTPPVTPALAGDIVLGSRNRFGVNWRPLPGGVEITRLSDGALKKAGLEVGDIIIEVEGNTVTNQGENLEKVRDEVFSGKRTQGIIKVLRKNETLLFRIIKNKK